METFWIVVDMSTQKALYGLNGKTLKFLSELEAENFGKQICNSFNTLSITL
jgi:hypothetical protein